jgi:uncharacterized lipoprotein YmbA
MNRASVMWWSLLLSLAACVPAVQPQKTQLEIREFQTRSYETRDAKMVMKAVLNVLQDDNFIVKNANTELGLLSATKELDVSSGGEKFFAVLFAGYNARYKQNSVVECSANVSEHGEQTRVRMNFQMKVLDNRGGVMQITNIDDEAYYREFFAKVDKGVFIQKEKL